MGFLKLLGCAAVATSVGLVDFVGFISTGYGASMALQAVTSLVTFKDKLNRASLTHGLAVAAYGVRLAAYLAARNRKQSYNKAVLQSARQKTEGMNPLVKFAVWAGVSVLYAAMFLPAHAAMRQASPTPTAVYGLPLLLLGLALESEADRQKSSAKAKQPDRWVSSGLYRWCQYPNYLGEMMFWTGNLVAGASAQHSREELAAGVAGWACLIAIILGETKRMARKKEKQYGSDPQYVEYEESTPKLMPLTGWLPRRGRGRGSRAAGAQHPKAAADQPAKPKEM